MSEPFQPFDPCGHHDLHRQRSRLPFSFTLNKHWQAPSVRIFLIFWMKMNVPWLEECCLGKEEDEVRHVGRGLIREGLPTRVCAGPHRKCYEPRFTALQWCLRPSHALSHPPYRMSNVPLPAGTVNGLSLRAANTNHIGLYILFGLYTILSRKEWFMHPSLPAGTILYGLSFDSINVVRKSNVPCTRPCRHHKLRPLAAGGKTHQPSATPIYLFISFIYLYISCTPTFLSSIHLFISCALPAGTINYGLSLRAAYVLVSDLGPVGGPEMRIQ